MIGKTVSHYRVVAKLGAGGMGVVYRADDTLLERQVALKFLPADLSDDAAVLERFEREAKAAAALNHPNICTVYEIGEHEGERFIAMELLEGITMGHHVASRPLSTDEWLELAIQIADALDAAHERGIIHRDLKPSNVFLTERGQAKILDFGLAKLAPRDPDATVAAESPTILDTQLTAAGAAVGTAAYMSPEQARGQPVDHRTDLFSCGALLYEMATGRLAFGGPTTPVVFEAILGRDPEPVTAVNPEVPGKMAEIIERCLEKDPDLRYQSAADLRAELKRLRRGLESGAPMDSAISSAHTAAPASDTTAGASPRGAPSHRATIGVAAFLALMAVAFVVWQFMPAGAPPPTIFAPTQITSNPLERSVSGMAISPDGRYLAYADGTALLLRSIETGQDNAMVLPDGLRVWDVEWYPNGEVLLINGVEEGSSTSSLWSVPMIGGEATRLIDGAYWPQVAPDGSAIAFIRSETLTRRALRAVWVMDANGQNPRNLLSLDVQTSVWSVEWSPDSQWLAYGVWRPGTDAASYQIRAVRRMGEEDVALVSDNLLFQNLTGILPFVWGSDGRLIFARTEPPPNQQSSNLWAIALPQGGAETVGEPVRLTNTVGFNYRQLSLTGDGSRLVALLMRNQSDVYLGELGSDGRSLSTVTPLTTNEQDDGVSGWTADGSAVLFRSRRSGTRDIFEVALDGGSPRPVAGGPGTEGDAVATPDGWILYTSTDALWGNVGAADLMRVRRGGGVPKFVLELAPWGAVHCAPGAAGEPCILGERSVDESEYILYEFDAIDGKGAEIGSMPDRPPFTVWDLSPDGTRIAMVHNDGHGIRIKSLTTGEEQLIQPTDWNGFEFVSWAADGNGLYLAGGFARRVSYPALIYADLEGNVTPLRQAPNEWHLSLSRSPDGRYLAFSVSPFHGNVWMIEGF